MRARVRQLSLVSFTLTLATGVSCTDHPTSPRTTTRPREASAASLASASTVATVNVLPADSSLRWTMTGVSGAGFIFAGGSTGGTSQPYAWSAPYEGRPALLASQGAVISLGRPNSAGDAPGVSGSSVGFWARGSSSWTFTAIPLASYSPTRATGINDARQLVGFGNSPAGVEYALWWQDPTSAPTALPAPPVGGTLVGYRAIGINNTGDVVGDVTESTKSGTRHHAVRWTATSSGWTATLLADVGSTNYAYDVNDLHQVAGNSGSDAVLWSPPAYGAVIITTNQSAQTKIDACGRVIGYTGGANPSAWLWVNGVMTTLPAPLGTKGVEAVGIAADTAMHQGTIVGVALRGSLPPIPVRWSISACP